MSGNRYTEEFNIQAVKQITEQGLSHSGSGQTPEANGQELARVLVALGVSNLHMERTRLR